MTLIHVPQPPKSAKNPNRPASSLLKVQIEHLHNAEKRLPLRHRTNTYINAIRTEGEAAEYIREVTEAIHKAHKEAATPRSLDVRKRTKMAVVTGKRRARTRPSGAGKQSSSRRREQKK